MNKLFIFSNAFNTHILVVSLKYVFGNNFNEIIILQENTDKKLEEINEYHIVWCNNLIDAVKLSDYVIIWNDEGIPIESVQLIKNFCRTSKKTYLEIPIGAHQYSSIGNIKKIVPTLRNCPILLNISIGLGTLQPYVELTLNSIIRSINIDFKQYYSPITQNIINALDDTTSISEKKHSSDDVDSNTDKFSIVSLSIPDIEALYDYIDIFHIIRPDFVIVQTSLKYMTFFDLSSILKETYLININVLIESNYRVVNDEWIVKCDNRDVKNICTIDADARNLEDDLLKRIVSHFSLPKGIRRL